VPALLDANRRDCVQILPLLVEPSEFLNSPVLNWLQAVHGIPLSALKEDDRDEVFAKLIDAVLAKCDPAGGPGF
jgi:hypothetical protein